MGVLRIRSGFKGATEPNNSKYTFHFILHWPQFSSPLLFLHWNNFSFKICSRPIRDRIISIPLQCSMLNERTHAHGAELNSDIAIQAELCLSRLTDISPYNCLVRCADAHHKHGRIKKNVWLYSWNIRQFTTVYSSLMIRIGAIWIFC